MSLSKMTRWAAALLYCLAAGQVGAVSADSNVEILSTTAHRGVFNGVALAYTATVAAATVRNARGEAVARLAYTEYLAKAAGNLSERPVIFFFNGGPGAASLWLHIGGFGPKRVVLPENLRDGVTPPYNIRDNPQSPLDAADLVFLDPPASGLSRKLPAGDARDFYSVEADADAMLALINRWIEVHHRFNAPKYLFAESYGTARAVVIARKALDINNAMAFSGLLLGGQSIMSAATSWRYGKNIVSTALNLPGMTAAAWYHGRIPKGGRSLEQVLAEAADFARGDYIRALMMGSDLPQPARVSIAARLSELTGIDSGYFLAHDLSIEMSKFRFELLKDRKEVIGLYDSRYTAPVPQEFLRESGGEPSLDNTLPAYMGGFRQYLAEELNVTGAGEYRAIDEEASRNFVYRPSSDDEFASELSETMKRNPQMRVAFLTGYYDLTTPPLTTQFVLSHSDLPAARTLSWYYPAGHMTYTDEASYLAMAKDVHHFVSERKSRSD